MAKVKFDNLLGKYQGNAYPGMFADLADHLGVSKQPLYDLGLGWAPIVEFKKGPNFTGWWVIPERNAEADVVGLALRSTSDFKVMYPGSRHGLVYPLNPNHVASDPYSPGAHNWVRTMDAGIVCPVCQKPDGCLVAARNSSAPQAAVCIRVQSSKSLRFGYLHILRPEGVLANGSPLAPSEDPVIVVEGMSDVAAAMSLGLVAVGRPSNLAGLDELAKLVRGRAAIVIGENDRKPDGSTPGETGMIAATQALRKTCTSVAKLLPPADVKDLRQWITAYKLDKQSLLAYAKSNAHTSTEIKVLANDRPLTAARAFLEANYRMAGRYTLRLHAGQWFAFEESCYREVSPTERLRGELYRWFDDKFVDKETGQGVSTVPVSPGPQYMNAVMDAMSDPCPVKESAPCWINNATGPDPRELITFTNGILNVTQYLSADDDALLDPTPDYFSLFSLPFAFDPKAECPNWLAFLQSSLGDDPDKISLLQEWFGYCMTPDTSLQKLMLFVGPPRAGKSVSTDILKALVGGENSAGPELAQLTKEFGCQGLVGKLIAVINEAVVTKGMDGSAATRRLLSIVGEDAIDINRKNFTYLTGHKLSCRFSLTANEFPELYDHSGALQSRLLVINFKTSFVGREDVGLKERLHEELQGIALWALEGLRRVRSRVENRIPTKFTIPSSSKIAISEWRQMATPLAAFVEECCEVSPDAEVSRTELYDAWQEWSRERGMVRINPGIFKSRLHQTVSTMVTATYEHMGKVKRVFQGVKLQDWAARQFLGQPRSYR